MQNNDPLSNRGEDASICRGCHIHILNLCLLHAEEDLEKGSECNLAKLEELAKDLKDRITRLENFCTALDLQRAAEDQRRSSLSHAMMSQAVMLEAQRTAFIKTTQDLQRQQKECEKTLQEKQLQFQQEVQRKQDDYERTLKQKQLEFQQALQRQQQEFNTALQEKQLEFQQALQRQQHKFDNAFQEKQQPLQGQPQHPSVNDVLLVGLQAEVADLRAMILERRSQVSEGDSPLFLST
jgi:hypothetical protein